MAVADPTSHQPIPGVSYADIASHEPEHINDTAVIKQHLNGHKHSSDSSDEYVGAGQDSAPKSPVRGHKKVTSRSSNRSLKNAAKSQPKSEEVKVVYENKSNLNGSHLTSIKPNYDYEESLALDGAEKRQKPTLVSGRTPSAGWETSGIRFAPLNVPLKRRLQTLMVLLHTLMMFILVSFFFLCAANPLMWPILFPYTIYVIFSSAASSGNLSQRSSYFRSHKLWSLFASYFPARLHRTQRLEPTRKYIFGYHPHGIISHGAWSAFATDALGFSQLFPGITNSLLTLDSNFRVPFYRDYLLRMGLASVSKESITNILTRGGANGKGMGRAITIVIGGARESLETHPGSIRLVLKRRRGFIKLAITTGSDLVPVLCFGENEIYDTVDSSKRPWLHRAQMFMKGAFGFTAPIFHARGVFNYDVGIMPYRRPLNIVVGKPIKVEQKAVADEKYVLELQEKYINELEKMFDDWKEEFAPDRTDELEIIE